MKKLFSLIHYRFKLIISDLLFIYLVTDTIPCELHGNPGASWWIPKKILHTNSICYSGGVGEDISFDLSLINKYKVKIYAFDPTPRSIAFIEKVITKDMKNFHFFPYGLWKKNSKQKFFIPKDMSMVSHSIVNLQRTNSYFIAECRTLKSIMKNLNHNHIDLLKIDIEGAEYSVLENMLKDKIFPKVICLEFDQPASLIKIFQMVNRLLSFQYYLVKKNYYNFTFIHK